MIEYAELRIGNLVMYDDEIVVVDEINKRNAFLVCLDGAMFSNSKPLAEINPVPITNERMAKFGFAVQKVHERIDEFSLAYIKIVAFYGCNDNGSDSFHFIYDRDGRRIELQFVHQLQNLFYALTGTELKEEQEHIEAEQKNEFNPNWVSPPGDTISDWLEEKKMSHTEFAEKMEMPIMDLLMGIMPITDAIAEKLYVVTQIPKQFWINRERHYREGFVD